MTTRRTRALRAVGAILMLGGASVLATAAPALAAEVSYATKCTPPAASGLDPINGTTKADVTAPATAKVGDEVTVTWKFTQAASKNPDLIDLGANTVQPSGKVTVAGAQTGTVEMQGPRENPAIPKGGDMVLSDMTGTFKLTAAGDVTLAPGAYTINAYSTDTQCVPTETVPVAATITVTAGDGSSSSASASASASASTSASATASASATESASASASTTATPSSTVTGGDPVGTTYPGKQVSVPYACTTLIGDQSATAKITINAVKTSGGYDLTTKYAGSMMNSPSAISKGMITPTMKIKLGGAQTGTVDVTGPPNTKAFAQGDPITIDDLTGAYAPTATGKVTLAPGVLTIKLTSGGTVVATCTPSTTAVSLTLDTTPGTGTSGGSTSGGTSGTSGTSGDLAATGASNTGALHALALVAGTVLLLGGAVFTFTPWQRLRR
ncbi:MAG: hypothetical protein QOF84_6609 [Streptomyces sp.]|nr:hypothetical protein [Streptomyces sp.]